MITKRLLASTPEDIQEAGELLKAGKLVAVPTETVYGLAADARQPEAVNKIFAAKNRPTNHPLIVHMPGADRLNQWAKNIPEKAFQLAEAFWPGPLTLLLDKADHVSSVITGGLDTIGLRVPNQPVLLKLLREFDLAVAAPSANPYQKLSPTTAEHVLAGLDGKIAAVLDAGPCGVGTESTIVRINDKNAEILRSGPISADQIQTHLSIPVVTPEHHTQAVSGNKAVHYCPNAKVKVKTFEQIKDGNKNALIKIAALVFTGDISPEGIETISKLSSNHINYRHDFYAVLHELDNQNVDEIWVEAPPLSDDWNDIVDRLNRAAEK
ncbi:threonylcarbamoyl-AMP synthase [Aliikangiella marina]|uniref:Threonylcarbamoyl-AMP synthase n=1 Tax=Aliikangiella marina TaxID=1712262 RepID=A0A545T7L9_9GAMM|nr:threonylcarbamoyl-AMP synthase [Aliikangiella marina]